ncbi:hypothetical protein B0J18DRAFT_426830 [Chaetomium sp. MPI-SDFR-AT-0129]|nr:hypothetical protein B0J18DRAFT_426830 [Chaetomium sp. MPI-SDFR-AT-0129]
MMSASASSREKGTRQRLREGLGRLRSKFRPHAIDSTGKPTSALSSSPKADFEHSSPSIGSETVVRQDDAPKQSDDPAVLSPGIEDGKAVSESALEKGSSLGEAETTNPSPPSDLWSAAYREAVELIGKDVDITILQGESVAQLFEQLEQLDKDATQESAFVRGLRYPLTSLEPTAATVSGFVKSVTTIAISVSTADRRFGEQIGQLLQQLSYIDDCDTLGQKTGKQDIHKALVSVYQKLLEFYHAALQILSKKGAKLVMKIVLENGKLPAIVQDFLQHAQQLQKLVEKATLEIVEDIKNMLYDHRINTWLGVSDQIKRQGQYHDSLQYLRSNEACEFLLADPRFIDWYYHGAGSQQQLVILGDVGSGKTVAMSYLIDMLGEQNMHQLPLPKLCYYYCRDDGTGTAAHILSALTLSLLVQLPGLKKGFVEWYQEALASGIDPATNVKVLEQWLRGTLMTLDLPIIFAIDGLDECDKRSRSRLLQSLGGLSLATPRFKVLVSSRAEEEITRQLKGMSTITLVPDAMRDALIVERTVDSQLADLPEDVKGLVTGTLSRLAQGSAIWTKMTVELIEIRQINAFNAMRDFLEQLPQPRQLSELYANLLTRYTMDDPENRKLATTALEVLAVSKRPLSLLELGWAVALGVAPNTVSSVEGLAGLVDHMRVVKLIRPFVARIDTGDNKKYQVKLVHQSVKEFILAELVTAASSTSTHQAEHPPPPPAEYPEATMLNICLQYLLLNEINTIDFFSPELLAIHELPSHVDLFTASHWPSYDAQTTWDELEQDMLHYDPTERGFGEFFVYASCYWVDHFGAVSAASLLPALGDIERVCQAGSKRLANWMAQNQRPSCTILARYPFNPDLHDPLSVTALLGSEAMLRRMLAESDFSDRSRFRSLSGAGAAEQVLRDSGELSRVRLIWDSGVGMQIRTGEFIHLAVEQWSFGPFGRERGDWEVVFGLVNDMLEEMVRDGWPEVFVSLAVRTRCTPMLQVLKEAAQKHPGFASAVDKSGTLVGPNISAE